MEFTTDVPDELVLDFQEAYGKDADIEDTADFADNYCGDYFSALKFLTSLGMNDLLDSMSRMAQKYEDPTVVLDWLDDPQELANELVGFILRVKLGFWEA